MVLFSNIAICFTHAHFPPCLGEYYEKYDKYRNIVLKSKKKTILFIIIFYCDYRFSSVSPIFLYYDALVLSLEVALKAGDRSSGALGTDIFIY